MRVITTISISERQFAWARQQMLENDWDRAGDTEGISRYVQELIKKEIPKDWQPPRKPPPDPKAKPGPAKGRRRLATDETPPAPFGRRKNQEPEGGRSGPSIIDS